MRTTGMHSTGAKTVDELLRYVRRRQDLPPPEMRRYIRETAGVTQADMARVLGTTVPAIIGWERGEREPSGKFLQPYADLLHNLAWELIRR
jgi:DNA-binding transcriptional regulator YiaG